MPAPSEPAWPVTVVADYRILVTGSRTWTDRITVWEALSDALSENRSILRRPVIIHGDCLEGADAFAARFAHDYSHDAEPHPADWKQHGWRAGFVRNAEMVAAGAAVCLVFAMPCALPNCRRPKPHDTHGTAHCAGLAEAAGIPLRRITP